MISVCNKPSIYLEVKPEDLTLWSYSPLEDFFVGMAIKSLRNKKRQRRYDDFSQHSQSQKNVTAVVIVVDVDVAGAVAVVGERDQLQDTFSIGLKSIFILTFCLYETSLVHRRGPRGGMVSMGLLIRSLTIDLTHIGNIKYLA